MAILFAKALPQLLCRIIEGAVALRFLLDFLLFNARSPSDAIRSGAGIEAPRVGVNTRPCGGCVAHLELNIG